MMFSLNKFKRGPRQQAHLQIACVNIFNTFYKIFLLLPDIYKNHSNISFPQKIHPYPKCIERDFG